jgi:hypothetical protein
LGRPRKYSSNAERQRAFRERKQLEERAKLESELKAKQSSEPIPTAYFFEKYSLNQVQSAYAKFKQLCLDNGYDVGRKGDYSYNGKCPNELADVILDPETNIKFFEMSNFINNTHSWYCADATVLEDQRNYALNDFMSYSMRMNRENKNMATSYFAIMIRR